MKQNLPMLSALSTVIFFFFLKYVVKSATFSWERESIISSYFLCIFQNWNWIAYHHELICKQLAYFVCLIEFRMFDNLQLNSRVVKTVWEMHSQLLEYI